MTLPAARVSDMHVSPMVTGVVPHVGGPILTPCPTVIIGKLPAATAMSVAVCVGIPDTIVKGSMKVIIGKKPQARLTDTCAQGGMVTGGCPQVLVGG